MLDKYFWKKENKIKRNYDIEDHLFEKMKGATQVYDASVADIFNACIMELIESQDIELYETKETDPYAAHTFYILESNVAGLEKLNAKYGVSIRKLVNIAIRNVFEKEAK